MEAGLGDLRRSGSLKGGCHWCTSYILEPQPVVGGNVMCMCQFTDWLSSLIYYLRGGQHTLRFSIKPLSEFPFVASLYSGLSRLCWAARLPSSQWSPCSLRLAPSGSFMGFGNGRNQSELIFPTVVGFNLHTNIWEMKQNGRRITKSHPDVKWGKLPCSSVFLRIFTLSSMCISSLSQAHGPWNLASLGHDYLDEPLKSAKSLFLSTLSLVLVSLRSHRNFFKCPFPSSFSYLTASYMSMGDVKGLSQSEWWLSGSWSVGHIHSVRRHSPWLVQGLKRADSGASLPDSCPSSTTY